MTRTAGRGGIKRLLAVSIAVLGATILAISASDAGSSATNPTISVSPQDVKPGASVSTSGYGFPKRTKGRISFSGEVVSHFTTSRTGRFTTKWTVPDGAQSGPVKAKVSTRRASATLKVEAPVPPPLCSDGRDNDSDGKTDHPADPGCDSHTDDSENPDPPPDPPPSGAERWSNPETWGGSLPVAGETVTIPEGKTVYLDRSTPPLGGLQVDGTLIFEDDYVTLTSDWIMVHGKLQIGSEDDPFTSRARIVLTGADPDANVMNMGAKFIGVMGGELEVHGEQREGWTRLAATAAEGTRQITVQENPGWRAGDRISISSTDFDALQAEEATITGVNGNTFTLSRALDHEHWGTKQTIAGRVVDERAEVALLSRNVTIEGEENSSVDGFGGQIMAMMGGSIRMEGAELRRMGQENALRRYPIHFHMLGDAGENSYLRDTSIHHTYNRCITIHGTNRLEVSGNVCYDHVGHGYFMEDGAEHDNVIEDNLGFVTREPEEDERLLESDRSPATFWITNPDNTVKNNVAAGSEGFGFWLAFPEHPTGLSANENTWPRRTPLGVFSGNVTHSNSSGLHVDDGPNGDAEGNTEGTYYYPVTNPANEESAPVVARFEDLTAYKNRYRGVWMRGENHRLTGATLADNAMGATFASHESFLEGSLVVGETDNLGNPYSWEDTGEGGRSLPLPWEPDFPIRGYEFYDGLVGARNTTFANFQPTAQRGASGLGVLLEDHFDLHPRNFATNLTFVNAKRVYLPGPAEGADGDRNAVFTDTDGSVTGAAGGVVTADNPFLTTDGCSRNAGWNAYVCPPGTEYATLIAGVWEDGDPQRIKPLRIIREDGVTQTLYGCCDYSTEARSTIFTGRQYEVRYNGGTPDRLRFVLQRGDQEHVILEVPYARTPKVTKYGCDLGNPNSWCGTEGKGRTTSLNALRNADRSSYYYDDANDTLYLRVHARDIYDDAEVVDYEELKVAPKP